MPNLNHAISFRLDGLDENGDGWVDKEEYMYAVKDALNADGHHMSDIKWYRTAVFTYIDNLYEISDLDRDGLLSPAEIEYGELLSASMSARAEATGEVLDAAKENFRAGAARAHFELTDTNGDGGVDEHEFREVARLSLASHDWPLIAPQAQVDEALGTIFHRADATLDGALSMRELQYAGLLVSAMMTHEFVVAMEVELDANGDGRIDRHEVLESIADEQAGRPSVGGLSSMKEEILDHFGLADLDGDGSLDGKERRRWAKSLVLGGFDS